MSGTNRNDERGIEAPGPLDRALDRDRDDRADLLEGGAARRDGRQAEGEIHVPVAEERLEVGTRAVELGEVALRKTVEQERVTIPVELLREEVHVAQRDITDRPARAGDALFQEGTIRVPVRGEEAVVTKEAVVTGEVVIDKERLVERQTVTDTVRRERVEVEEHFARERAGFERHFAQRAAGSGRTFEQAAHNYRAGLEAAHDERHAGRRFEDVEPELRARHAASGAADDWERLREEVREGLGRARG